MQSRRESKKIFNVSNIKRLLFEQIQIDKDTLKFYVIFFWNKIIFDVISARFEVFFSKLNALNIKKKEKT